MRTQPAKQPSRKRDPDVRSSVESTQTRARALSQAEPGGGGSAAEWVKPSALKPWPQNPTKDDPASVRRVAESIKRFGFGAPLVARRANSEVIAGHTRLRAAKQLGIELVPVRYLDISEKDAHVLALADNRLAELTQRNNATLAEQLKELDPSDQLLAGYTGGDVQSLMREVEGDADVIEDDVPEPPKTPVTKPGDVWTLGRHRLVCGDCTKAESWDAGGTVDAVVTSPPYALGSGMRLRGPNASGTKLSPYAESEDAAESWLPLMRTWTGLALERAQAVVVNVQLLAPNKRALMWWNENSDRFCDLLVWDKGTSQPAMADGVCNSRHELLVVLGKSQCSRKLPFSNFRGTLDNVYAAPAVRVSDKAVDDHGAVFPVHLPAFVMRRMCGAAKRWADPFCGTGTSIIAAEQLDRSCVGIELSPAYCDVIIERWQNLTGGKAERGSS